MGLISIKVLWSGGTYIDGSSVEVASIDQASIVNIIFSMTVLNVHLVIPKFAKGYNEESFKPSSVLALSGVCKVSPIPMREIVQIRQLSQTQVKNRKCQEVIKQKILHLISEDLSILYP